MKMKPDGKLSEKAAAISGALTGVVLHAGMGMFGWGASGMMGGAFGSRYYGMMQFANPVYGFGGLFFGTLLGLIVGGFVGWLIAVTYNWGLRQ